MSKKPKYLLETGNYSQIIRSEREIKGADRKYYLAALSFSGDREKTEVTYHKTSWLKKDQVEVAFYWLLSSLRTQSYNAMTEAFLELFHFYEKLKNKRNKFYLYQGLALVRYYQGYLESCCYFSSLAYKLSVELEDPYFSMISTDLAGHAFSRKNAFSRGEYFFDLSLSFANKIEKNLNSRAIDLSLLSYRVEAGYELSSQQKALKTWEKSLKPDDFYSATNAILLKIQSYILNGNLAQAKQELQIASRMVFKHGHKRQLLEYNLKLIEISKIQGERETALNLLNTTLQLCQKNHDEYYLYRFLKLRAELEGKLSGTDKKELIRLENRVGINHDEGRLAYWKKRLEKEHLGIEDLKKLDQENLLGVLYLNNIYPSTTFIDFSWGKKALLLSTGEEIKLITTLTPNQLLLLEILCEQTNWNKKDLFERFWGVKYDSFIHDNKIYVTLRRLEKKIQLTSPLFYFKKGSIEVKKIKIMGRKVDRKLGKEINRKIDVSECNFRQAQLLSQLTEGTIIRPSEYAQRFEISRNTASRDLGELVNLGRLKKFGVKKGTYYMTGSNP